jgi:hypothetical protein
MIKLYLHYSALIAEAIGTLFIFLDHSRMSARYTNNALGSFGDMPGFEAWYYHCPSIGFALLFVGLLLAGIVLASEHQSLRSKSIALQQSKTPSLELPNS